MAILAFGGFEFGSSPVNFTEHGTLSGTASFDTGTKRTGSYALRVNPTTTATGIASVVIPNGTTGVAAAPSLANFFCSFYFYIATAPGSNNEIIFRGATASEALELRLTSSRTLSLYNATTLLASGSTVLALNTWYRIEVNYNDTANTQTIRINGVDEITNSLTTTGSFTGIHFGKFTNRNGQSVDFYYDDWIIDDANWPADGACLVSLPIGSGADSGWTNGSGNTFAEADDIPIDSDTTYIGAHHTQDNLNHTFNMQSAGTLGISSATIRAVKPMVIARTVSTTGTSAVRLRTVSGGSGFERDALELTTSYNGLSVIYETDPLDAAAWTPTKFDTLEVGMAADALAQAQRFTSAVLMVWYSTATPVDIEIDAALKKITAALSVNQSQLVEADPVLKKVTASIGVNQSQFVEADPTLRKVTAAINVYMRPDAEIDAAVRKVTASLSVSQEQRAEVDAALRPVMCSISIEQRQLVTVDADLAKVQASVSAYMRPDLTIGATLSKVVASLAVGQSQLIEIDTSLVKVAASINVYRRPEFTIGAALRAITSAVIAYMRPDLTIGASLRKTSAQLSAEQRQLVAIGAALIKVMASLTVSQRQDVNIGVLLAVTEAALSIQQRQEVTIGATLRKASAADVSVSQEQRVTIVAALARVIFSGSLEADIAIPDLIAVIRGLDSPYLYARGTDRERDYIEGRDSAYSVIRGRD